MCGAVKGFTRCTGMLIWGQEGAQHHQKPAQHHQNPSLACPVRALGSPSEAQNSHTLHPEVNTLLSSEGRFRSKLYFHLHH